MVSQNHGGLPKYGKNLKLLVCVASQNIAIVSNETLWISDYSADRKSKHPTFILASYGAEYYRHSFSTIKANTRHLF